MLYVSVCVCARNSPLPFSQFLFQQLGMLVSFVRSHIRPYMDEIVTLMRVSPGTVSCRKMSPRLWAGREDRVAKSWGRET